jgi:hypothetical protein
VKKLLLAAAPAILFCALQVHAQQQSPATSNLLAVAATPGQVSLKGNASVPPAVPAQTQIAPKNHRLFGVLANYTTVENQEEFSALSTKVKFELSLKTMTDPVTVSFIGGVALIGQARNSDPSYGQGMQGYGKRFGTFYADTGIGTLMTTSVFPTVLHQDPRYFQLGTGSIQHRALYSLSQIFVTRGDNGERQFNYSEILGNGVAAGLANAYHPESQRTLGDTFNVWGTDILLNSLCNLAKEFWPDIHRKFRDEAHSNGLRFPASEH